MKYITIVRKSDFIDLFKYGHLFINDAIPLYEMDIDSIANNESVFDALISHLNTFEYSFEYILIYFNKDKFEGSSMLLNILDVLSLYAFSEQAQKEFLNSFDHRINIGVSHWASKFEYVQQQFFYAQCIQGIDNMWDIFGLPIKDKTICEEEIGISSLKEAFRLFQTGEHPSGDQSLWTYLLRYERHSLYPNNVSGYFCDLIHVYCNFLKKKELIGDVAKQTKVYENFKNNRQAKFKELSDIIEKSELALKIQEVTKFDFSVIAPLFLLLKHEFSDGLNSESLSKNKQIIDHSKGFGISFSMAAYLLGFTLGYDKTYDALYDTISLPIFKSKIESAKSGGKLEIDNIGNSLDEKNHIESSNKDIASSQGGKAYRNQFHPINQELSDPKDVSDYKRTLFPIDENIERKPIAYMYDGKKSSNLIPVFSKEEKKDYKNKGYKQKRIPK